MKAAFKKDGRAFLREIEAREPGPDEVRVKVAACGVCGTDLHAGGGGESGFGHEVAGTVVAAGPAANVEVGREIVLDSSTACGRCDACRNARQELCTDVRSFFHLGSFGFAEEMVAPAISAIYCDGLEPAVACLQEPLGVAIDLVRLAEVEPDSNVLVMGLGAIGLMALALVRRAGARRVFASQPARRRGRIALAERLGVDAVIDPLETPLAEHDFGCRIDRILVTSPPRTLPDAFRVAAKGGVIAFIGIEHGDGARCTFDANAFHFKKLQLRASFASPALFGPLALQYLREGVVDGRGMVSHRFGLDRIDQALETARSDPAAVKVVVMP